MCLVATKQNILNAERTRKTPGKIYAWKVLCKNQNAIYSAIFQHKWDIGWNRSDRRTIRLYKYESGTLKTYGDCDIDEGIHVYLRKQDAIDACHRSLSSSYVVVRVECHNKHLVARGKRWLVKEAVYMKVFLSREEYKNATK